MAIKVNGTTVIDNSRNISNVGSVTATSFSGDGSGLTNVPSSSLTPTFASSYAAQWWPQKSRWLKAGAGAFAAVSLTSDVASSISSAPATQFGIFGRNILFQSSSIAAANQGWYTMWTANGGSSWSYTQHSEFLQSDGATDGTYIFSHGNNFYFRRSSNGGQSFSNTAYTAQYTSLPNTTYNGTYAFAGGYYYGASPSTPKLYRSSDGFGSYTDISSNLPSGGSTIAKMTSTSNGTLFIAVNYDDFWGSTRKYYKSTDHGSSWTELGAANGLVDYPYFALPSVFDASGGFMFMVQDMGTNCTVYYSEDEGVSFKSFIAPIEAVSTVSVGGASGRFLAISGTVNTVLGVEL